MEKLAPSSAYLIVRHVLFVDPSINRALYPQEGSAMGNFFITYQLLVMSLFCFNCMTYGVNCVKKNPRAEKDNSK